MRIELEFFKSSERLPGEFQEVLLFNLPDKFAVGRLEKSDWAGDNWFYHGGEYNDEIDKFEYWALLPGMELA